MSILFYNHTGKVSGAERLLLMILAQLDRAKFEPIVVCPREGSLMQSVIELGIPAESLTTLEARFTWRPDFFLAYLKSLLAVTRQLRQKAVDLKPQLIHANSIRAGLVATAATLGLGTRVVWHLHDILPRHPLSSAIRIFALFSRRTRMIAVSKAVAENFAGAVFPLKRRVTVILNALELEKFQPETGTRRRIFRELDLSTTAEPIIGIVGQLTPRKGQLELIRAFAQVLKDLPGAVLLIVGAPLFNKDEEYARQLKKTVAALGIADRVHMTGARSDVGAVMQALDLLVVNSSVEPFGLVVLEAMASGACVIAAASGGIPEIIQHGKNGWLVPTGDGQALSNAIINLSRHPTLRKRLAKEGKRIVASNFSAHRYMAELQSFYGQDSDTQSRTVNQETASRRAEKIGLAKWIPDDIIGNK